MKFWRNSKANLGKMTCNNPKLDHVNNSISMHIQNLDKFYKRFLKILSGNKIMTDGRQRTDGMTDNPNPI